MDTHSNTGSFEVYYVDVSDGAGDSFIGAASIRGIVLTDDANTKTAAHELGHALGFPIVELRIFR